MRNLIMVMPSEFAVLVIVAAGLAMTVGARRVATGLFGGAMAIIFLPVLLEPLFDALPGGLMVGLLVVFGLGLVRTLFELVIGKNSTDHMVDSLAAQVVRAMLRAPLRMVGWIVRLMLRRP